MNATQTAILEALQTVTAGTVRGLVEDLGKSETTIRKGLKDLAAEGLVENNHGDWSVIVSIPDGPAAPDGLHDHLPTPDEQADAHADAAKDDQPVTRRYRRHDKPTTRTVRTNQITKCEVAVVRTDEDEATAKAHGITKKWMTVCQTHNHAVGTDKVLDAHWFSSYPLFCGEVRKLVQAAVGRRRANPTSSPEAAKRWMPKAS